MILSCLCAVFVAFCYIKIWSRDEYDTAWKVFSSFMIGALFALAVISEYLGGYAGVVASVIGMILICWSM